MAMTCVNVILAFLCTAAAVDGRFYAPLLQSKARMRRLLQDEVATGVRVADFSNLPSNLTAEVEYSVPEKQLKGNINISSTNSEPVSYGTYFLGPDQVRQLNETISAEMVRTVHYNLSM